MKSSSYIKHIARTNIVKKGQRTLLSLISILLSTAIIFTSLTLFINVFTFSKNVNYDLIGNYHFATLISDEVKPSTRYDMTSDINTNLYGVYHNEPFNWRELEISEATDLLPFTITDGHLPTKSNQILISNEWGIEVGQTIQLTQEHIQTNNTPENLYQISSVDVHAISSNDKAYQVVGTYEPIQSFKEHTGNTPIVYSVFSEDQHANRVYYVLDNQIQLSDAYSYFLERFHVSDENVYTNLEVISNDSVKNYLQDTTVILVMFVMIAAIGICVSLISVHNVLIISDKDRKKELGLLKSIGATPNEVKNLITIELVFLGVVGAILGLALGCTVSYIVLNLFISKLYITFNISMIINPIIIAISFISGVALMYVSGMNAYGKYISSTAISDLKEFSYDYAEPVKPKNRRHRTFAWRMFSIYNGRMKKQTKNIYQSFTLFLFTCVLFMSTFLSNTIYVNRYVSKGYDFEIQNYLTNVGKIEANSALSYELYQKEKEGAYAAKTVYAERIMLPQLTSTFFMTKVDAYDKTLLESYKVTQAAIGFNIKEDENGEEWCDTYHFPVALDQMQFDEIKKYLVAGSLDNLTANDVVSIQSKTHRLGSQLCTNLKVGDEVAWDGLTNKKNVAAIIVLPDEAYEEGLHFNYEEYPRVMAFSMDSIIKAGKGTEMNEHIYIKLVNSTAASSMLDIIDSIMYETDTFETYECNAVALTVETNRFATFIIEALLYPLFFMLFIVSLMNLNNVFIGNVHLKRGDISVMKSVGMTNAQLSLLFTFEYFEGYVNAALISVAVFIPIVLLEGLLGIPSVYEFGSNIIGTLLIGIFFLGVLLVAPLIVISLKRIQRILPIENLKNVD